MRTRIVGWIAVSIVLVAVTWTLGVSSPAAAIAADNPATPQTATPSGPYTVRIPLKGERILRALVEHNFDILAKTKDGQVDVVADNDEALRFLRTLGVPIAVIRTPDMPLPSSSALDANLGLYHTYAELTSALLALEQGYPGLADRFPIGYSVEGRSIYALKISDNVSVDENEPEVLYMGNHHARELMSVDIPLRFAQYLLANYGTDPDVTAMVNEREIFFVPMVNPDGHIYVELNHSGASDYWWRKNRRPNTGGSYGVDLNRNYGYMWGYDNNGSSPDPTSDIYRGTAAFSENETERIRTFCKGRQFILGFSFHTYGEWLLYPWGYIPTPCPDDALFAALADSLVSGNGYTPGAASTTLYPTNGDTDDWAYGETVDKPRMYLFTPEMNTYAQGGFGPADTYIQPTFNLLLQMNMDLLHFADNPWRIMPPSQPTQYAIDDAEYPLYTVNWAPILPPDPNPSVAYDVVEYKNLGTVAQDGANAVSDLWTFDGFTVSTARKYEGTGSYYSGNTESSASQKLQMSTFYRVTTDTDSLRFRAWYNIETDWDYGYVEVSTNGGVIWSTLPGNITTNYNPHGTNRGNGITGASAGWVLAIFPLTSYLGSELDIRFNYVTDQAYLEEGIYIDLPGPVPTFETMTVAASAIPDTFLAVTPHEEAAFTYCVRAHDAQNQIGQWSLSRSITIEGVTGIGDTPVLASRLGANYPNPFNPTTRIPYTVGASAGAGRPVDVVLAIYNVAGERVATLVDRPVAPGRYEAVWAANSDNGRSVASGVYFVRLTVGSEQALTRKLVLLK
jgi:hypothetical protein